MPVLPQETLRRAIASTNEDTPSARVVSPIDVKWFGAVGDGVTDDTAAIQAAFTYMRTNAPRAGLSFPPGIYPITSSLLVEGNSLVIMGSQAVLKATAAMSALIVVGNGVGGAVTEMLKLHDLFLDCNSLADYGLHIREGHNHSYANLSSSGAVVAGCFVDGSANAGDIRVLNFKFSNCYFTGPIGFLFDKGPNLGAYERFTLMCCGSEGGSSLIRAIGDFGMTIIGGSYQNASAYGLYVDAAKVAVYGSYFENAGVVPALHVTNGALVSSSSTQWVAVITYGDANSTVRISDFTRGNAQGTLRTDSKTGRLSDRTGWGSPLWPVGLTGSINQKGLGFTDNQGVEWMCTTAGTSSGSRFIPKDGWFVIPMPYTEFSNGKLWWWAMEDFIVTDLLFVVTATFTGAAVTGFGTYYDDAGGTPFGGDQNWISTTQGAIANLTTGAVLNAKQNAVAGNLLGTGSQGAKYLAGKGGDQAGALGSSIRQFGDAVGWTAGMGYLLVRGFNLKYNGA